MIIYKAINQVNGKIYIGQTIQSLEQRKREHINDSKSDKRSFYFHKALNKYGADNFFYMIINECDNIDLLNKLEEYYISYYESTNKEIGYNLDGGGKNNTISEETREKMRLRPIMEGENHWNYGRTTSENTKNKQRQSMKKR